MTISLTQVLHASKSAVQSASTSDPYALIHASRQLESVFMGQVLDAMAETIEEETLFGSSPGLDMAQGWLRTEIAKRWSASGHGGLGDGIARKLGGAPVALALSGGGHVPQAPVKGRITSPFGMRVHPLTGLSALHEGIDIAAAAGSTVRSPFAGVVEGVKEDSKLGLTVVIRHASGYQTIFGHLEAVLVQPGSTVSAGGAIARSGSSGKTTGPHLHFSLFQEGRAIDPGRWIPALRPTVISSAAKKMSVERQVFDALSDKD
ncbi:MAG: M23 family metallopeptidase [Myxococcota bacterium]